jgi:membrane protein implicated in regulation of membrane protease activity
VAAGAVELNGTRWRAIAETPLAAGAAAVVVGRRDLTLLVRADRG